MEALPRMPMLAVELKYSAASVDFGPKISEYIRKVYEDGAESYDKEIAELNALREKAVKAPADFTGCALLKKYFSQLTLLKNRFPMESEDEAAVIFSWFDKYSDMSNTSAADDIRFEMACILHNIGALHSYLGSLDNRLNSEGMKISCTHFQCASFAFQHLKDNFNGHHFTADFDATILSWHANLMIAQAQECILEKSLTDNRKANIIAKVARQTSLFYKECSKVLDELSIREIVGSSKCKSWKKFMDLKDNYCGAICYFYRANQGDEKTEVNHGERLAYLQESFEAISRAQKLGAKESLPVSQALQFAADLIGEKYNAAKKENDFIYHDKIPTLDSLPTIKGAILVKPLPFEPLDPEISGNDIFKRLVPLDVHKSASLYSEEKAKLLREISERSNEKDEQLEEYLAAVQLDALHFDRDFNALPISDALLERCASFNANPNAVPDLLASMNKLSTLYRTVDGALTEFDCQLIDAEKDLKACEQANGDCAELKGLRGELAELRSQLSSYAEAAECAARSNTELHKALAQHSDNLNLLAFPLNELKKHLPTQSFTPGLTPEGLELKRLLDKVDEMKSQRGMLLDQLREQIVNDDITKILLAHRGSDGQEIFDKEIKKHEKLVNIIDQNLTAQGNILEALTDANAKYAKLRKQTVDLLNERDQKIESLIESYDIYLDLTKKSKQGISFYENLQLKLLEFNKRLTKLAQKFNEVEASSKKIDEKEIPKIETASFSTNTAQVTPRLKDYMSYYQSTRATKPALMQTNLPPPSAAGPGYAPPQNYFPTGVPVQSGPAASRPQYQTFGNVWPNIANTGRAADQQYCFGPVHAGGYPYPAVGTTSDCVRQGPSIPFGYSAPAFLPAGPHFAQLQHRYPPTTATAPNVLDAPVLESLPPPITPSNE